MKRDYYKFVAAVYVFLIKDDQILLLRRFNTGYEDGKYSVPAGHLEANERATQAIIREGREETGITLTEDQLKVVHVMHRKSETERIDFFFQATEWQGEPKNMEPDKCDDLSWFPLNALPDNMIPCVRAALENSQHNIFYSELDWDN